DGIRDFHVTGVQTCALPIFPYLVAMLVALAVFRSSGALDSLANGVRALCERAGWDTAFVDALPVALMKPFSGSGARAMLLDVMRSEGRRGGEEGGSQWAAEL